MEPDKRILRLIPQVDLLMREPSMERAIAVMEGKGYCMPRATS